MILKTGNRAGLWIDKKELFTKEENFFISGETDSCYGLSKNEFTSIFSSQNIEINTKNGRKLNEKNQFKIDILLQNSRQKFFF